jgi:hypothetical protein
MSFDDWSTGTNQVNNTTTPFKPFQPQTQQSQPNSFNPPVFKSPPTFTPTSFPPPSTFQHGNTQQNQQNQQNLSSLPTTTLKPFQPFTPNATTAIAPIQQPFKPQQPHTTASTTSTTSTIPNFNFNPPTSSLNPQTTSTTTTTTLPTQLKPFAPTFSNITQPLNTTPAAPIPPPTLPNAHITPFAPTTALPNPHGTSAASITTQNTQVNPFKPPQFTPSKVINTRPTSSTQFDTQLQHNTNQNSFNFANNQQNLGQNYQNQKQSNLPTNLAPFKPINPQSGEASGGFPSTQKENRTTSQFQPQSLPSTSTIPQFNPTPQPPESINTSSLPQIPVSTNKTEKSSFFPSFGSLLGGETKNEEIQTDGIAVQHYPNDDSHPNMPRNTHNPHNRPILEQTFTNFECTQNDPSQIPPQRQYPAPTPSNPFPQYENEDDIPLLEELGIDFSLIFTKTRQILKLPFSPTLRDQLKTTLSHNTNNEYDLTGPLVFCLVLGILIMVLQQKMSFGYIYGYTVMGCIGIWFICNVLCDFGINIDLVFHVIGYSFVPLLILPFVRFFGITIFHSWLFAIQIIAFICILSSTAIATLYFECVIHLTSQRYIIAYPIALFYFCFVLLIMF